MEGEELAPDAEVEESPPDAPPRQQGGIGAAVVFWAVALGLVLGFAPLHEGAQRHAIFLIGAIALLIGFWFFRVGVEARLAAAASRRRERSALEPWLRDRDWSREGTGPVASERLFGRLVGLVLMIVLVVPFHTIWTAPLGWWGFWLVVAGLDVLAASGLGILLRTLWMRLRGGSPRLRWHAVPVAPGATFAARFETTRTLPASRPATLGLRCLRDRTENVSRREEAAPGATELSVTTVTAPVRARPEGGTVVDVAIRVPADAPPTNGRIARPIRWQLEVRIPTAGADSVATFPVPIY